MNKYNQLHRWKKRGLAIIPTKYFISFGAIFMNQSGALVKIYKDGSVLVSHGGTEIGQGLHTKMIQAISAQLFLSLRTFIECLPASGGESGA